MKTIHGSGRTSCAGRRTLMITIFAMVVLGAGFASGPSRRTNMVVSTAARKAPSHSGNLRLHSWNMGSALHNPTQPEKDAIRNFALFIAHHDRPLFAFAG